VAVFPPKTTFVNVPDPTSPPPGALEVSAEFLDDFQDYVLNLPQSTDVDAAVQAGLTDGVIVKFYDGTQWPIRPDTSVTGQHVLWVGPSATPPATTGTASGGTRARAPFDLLALS
jgi:hypothetical protein